MPGILLLPPEYHEVAGPVVFLAGPIQGAPPWQTRATDLLQAAAPALHIASPRRPAFDDLDAAGYNAQVDWETHYLRRAAADGVILFWLAREEEHRCERAFAQTTRFELGEWTARHRADGAKLVVGIEAGFTGARYIRRRLAQDCPAIPICDTLEANCEAAIRLIYG